MLGSSFGSTNAASIDPATGQPLWPRFSGDQHPRTIVTAQKGAAGLASGSSNLVAVAGPSYGGYQAF